jgi:RNA-directed DNA polymerase
LTISSKIAIKGGYRCGHLLDYFGHYQYFGVIFNYRSLRVFKACVVKDWRKVLGKRSQKGCMNWANYRRLLIAFPLLPEPVIHQAWRK